MRTTLRQSPAFIAPTTPPSLPNRPTRFATPTAHELRIFHPSPRLHGDAYLLVRKRKRRAPLGGNVRLPDVPFGNTAMPTYAERVMAEMASERSSLGIIDGKPLPIDARDRVLNRMVALFIAEAPKAKRKPKVSEMTDEDWLISLESEPSLKGINIRQELGKAQFWCKQNKRVFYRYLHRYWS